VKAADRKRLWNLAPAMIALVGVMIGATLAGGFDYYRDTRKDGQELQQAKRLVAFEISLIGTELTGPSS
jgi:hypothetical protein